MNLLQLNGRLGWMKPFGNAMQPFTVPCSFLAASRFLTNRFDSSRLKPRNQRKETPMQVIPILCPKCHQYNHPREQTCKHCGRPLEQLNGTKQ